MLTQRKRKRTVEDFNQFCTFVLAYAGYIPYPTEEQQCKDNTLSSRILCSTESSEEQTGLAPPATQPVRSVEAEDRARPRRDCKENRKRRNKEMRSVGMVERNPHSRKGDFVAGKKSSRNKETPKNGSLNEVQFSLKNGPIVYSSFCADGANSVMHANNELPSPEVLSLSPKQCGHSDTETDGLPVLKQESEMESCDTYCDQSKQEPVDRAGHEESKKEGKVYPLCASNNTAARHCHNLSDKGVGDGLEVEEEPMDLTLTVQAERLEGNPVQGGQGREGAVKEEGGVWAKEEKEEVEAWERDAVGGADVLRMVMERQAGAERPEDQDTGYHTDWNGSTPDRAGSDTDPEFRPAHKDAAASSGYSTEGLNSETSHMEDDDSWDLITCFCLKPFAGRPMIECSECNTWVHLSCAKIRRTHVPDVFVCASCRSSKQNIRRSGRARVAPRKRFSD